MAEMSPRFNFDDFDAQIQEALDQNEQAMRPFIRHPGQVGGVAVLGYRAELPEPPELPPAA